MVETIRTFADLDKLNAEQYPTVLANLGGNVLRQLVAGVGNSYAKYNSLTKQSPLVKYTEQRLKFWIPNASNYFGNQFRVMLISKLHIDDDVLWGEGILIRLEIVNYFSFKTPEWYISHATIRFDTYEITLVDTNFESNFSTQVDTWREFMVAFDPEENLIKYTLQYSGGDWIGSWPLSAEVFDAVGFCGIYFDSPVNNMEVWFDNWRIENLD